MSVQDAANRLAVSTKTIRRWIASGDLDARRVGPRLIRIDAASLDRLGRALSAPHTR
ncbi:helix-turn-helix domain-containing protein [Naasia aerilata]|uniref:helix-turn-helix domain-containing protein n=1 Tax=Naasia aerilata TaxID=1162966 RepID=UPI002572A624|nr:helix-turn-helix domain-containing protein [Naasia aerilata]